MFFDFNPLVTYVDARQFTSDICGFFFIKKKRNSTMSCIFLNVSNKIINFIFQPELAIVNKTTMLCVGQT